MGNPRQKLSVSLWDDVFPPLLGCAGLDILCGEGLVVHEEEVNVPGVVDEESLVSGGHHMAGLLV